MEINNSFFLSVLEKLQRMWPGQFMFTHIHTHTYIYVYKNSLYTFNRMLSLWLYNIYRERVLERSAILIIYGLALIINQFQICAFRVHNYIFHLLLFTELFVLWYKWIFFFFFFFLIIIFHFDHIMVTKVYI